MKILFAGQVPKEPAYPDDNEDALEIAKDCGRIVISDGASESFDSKTWAHLLTATFIQAPELSPDWLENVITSYRAHFDFASLSWSKQAAFLRGSFATLLSVDQPVNSDIVNVISIGDSLAVLLDGDELISSFPYINHDQFQQRPQLLCTEPLANKFIALEDFSVKHQTSWSLQGRTSPIVMCMTDALGQWALRNWQEGNPQWQQLSLIREAAQLESLVMQERATKNLRVDDTTLVTLSFEGSEKDELPDP